MIANRNRQPPSHYLAPGYSLPLTRAWQEENTSITPNNLVYPIFITDEDPSLKREISALPGQYHLGYDAMIQLLDPLVESYGLRCVILFGVPTKGRKTNHGVSADSSNSPVVVALKRLKKYFGDKLVLMADVCMCAYTDHGHCGVMDENGRLNNSESVARLAEIALNYARAGADIVSPSDMMDGRIGALKTSLADNGYGHVPVMSYSAKFASALYGPFRSACATSLKGDRRAYQLPPGSIGLAARAIKRDLEEGADFLMVKPGTLYLDVIRLCKEMGQGVPVAVYHVSGEYAMLYHGAKAGSIDLKAGVMESMQSMRRAGADIILTYYTPLILQWIAKDKEVGKSKL
eukprot:PhF_6_TR1433/c0_g1_i2/m.2531/K01698/hemB, ALAD; porphobilinogen synthase